jgi:hypothetical protein
MTGQPLGWYPDPNESNAEVYWDGKRWHGRRDKLKGSVPSLPPTSHPNVGILRNLVAAWDRLSVVAQVVITVAMILLVAGIVSSVLKSKPWESDKQKACEAAMTREGYKGQTYDQMVNFCVNFP